MDDHVPPLPARPDFQSKPPSSPVWWVVTALGALGLFVLLAILVTPILWVGVAIAAIIGLQYLIWGWWFERVYRSQPADDEPPSQKPF
jgi:hypothetical protein